MIVNVNSKGVPWKRSSLEKTFEFLWEQMYPEIELHAEQSLIEGRKFRSDFVHYPSKTSIELQGGLANRKGGHTTLVGTRKDYFKSNELLKRGYVTIFIGTGEVDKAHVEMVAEIISMRSI